MADRFRRRLHHYTSPFMKFEGKKSKESTTLSYRPLMTLWLTSSSPSTNIACLLLYSEPVSARGKYPSVVIESVRSLSRCGDPHCILTFLPSTRAGRSEIQQINKNSGPIKGQCTESEVLEIIVCVFISLLASLKYFLSFQNSVVLLINKNFQEWNKKHNHFHELAKEESFCK